MKFALVEVILSVACTLRLVSARRCEITGQDNGMDSGWAIRIIKDMETVTHGALVSHTQVISVFKAYLNVALDSSLLPKYLFVAYGTNPKGEPCRQNKKAKKIIPPPEWPRLKPDQVRDVAFWKLDADFDTSANYPFLFPADGDISQVTNAIGKTHNGESCVVQSFAVSDPERGVLNRAKVIVSPIRFCALSFCKDGVCGVDDRYGFCVIDVKRKQKEALWHQGALLSCRGKPLGILGQVGQKASKGMTLFIDLLTVWEVYNRQDYHPNTTTRNVLTKATVLQRASAAAAVKKASTTMATMTAAPTTLRYTYETTMATVFTSRLPSPPNAPSNILRPSPAIKESKKHIRAAPKPSSGSTLVLVPRVLALCAAAFYERF